ncbi:MAG: hypothetical protein ACRERV_08415, partial [Methylococcales bacterium]
MLIQVQNTGETGVNKDLSTHELPINAWTDARNIRFRDGLLERAPGYLSIYGTPLQTAQHLVSVRLGDDPALIYAGINKVHVVRFDIGTLLNVHTDITHATPRTGVANEWTAAVLSGVPVLNSAASDHVPMSWDLNVANDFINLVNWPSTFRCKAFRSYKNILFALNITKAGVRFPFMVKWSHPADPGTLPVSWDQTNPAFDAGELDIAEGEDHVIDGLQLRDSFIVYKERSIWRMDYSGGLLIFSVNKVLATNGALNKNCVVEVNGRHVVFGDIDLMVHDGQSGESILDKKTRLWIFGNIDADNRARCFVAKNPYSNEVWFCFPEAGNVFCNLAVVYNYADATTSIRELPVLHHAVVAPINDGLFNFWDSDSETWNDDLSLWNSSDGPSPSAVLVGGSFDGLIYGFDLTSRYGV